MSVPIVVPTVAPLFEEGDLGNTITWLVQQVTALLAGGSGILHQANITLNNDNIINLPTLAFELLPAPGSEFITELHDIRLFSVIAADGGYTNINTGAYIFLSAAGNDGAFFNNGTYFGYDIVTTLLEGESLTIDRQYTRGFPVADIGNPDISIQTYSISDTSNAENKAITIRISNAANGNLQDGNIDNILIVAFQYSIYNTATGQFE